MELKKMAIISMQHGMAELPVTTRDQYGRLFSGRFHDGYLIGLRLEESPKALCIALKALREEVVVELRLQSLKRLNVSLFLEGNIVSDLWAWPIAEMPEEYWKQLFHDLLHTKDYDKERERLISTYPQSHGFALDASYGCQLAAICDAIE